MSDEENNVSGDTARDAAEWFILLDRNSADARIESEFSKWLESDREHAAAFVRCEATAHLTKKLKDDDRVAWAFQEVARLARSPRRSARSLLQRIFRHPGLAWSVAAVSTMTLIASLVFRSGPDSMPMTEVATPALDSTVNVVTGLESAEDFTVLPGLKAVDRVAVLPGQIVVDVGSVAVLPFGGLGSEDDAAADPASRALATEVYEQVLEKLQSIPGVYVVGSRPMKPYRDTMLPLAEVAAQVGVRSIVQGRV